MNQDCIFCRILAGEIPAKKVYEDDTLLAFHDVTPQAPVHVLLIPKKHISTLLDTSVEDAELLGRLQHRAVEIARELGLSETGFRLVMNCLEGAGQSVFHIHLHLMGGRSFSWPPG
ncbi:MAG: histidine triad nucleotide-binding protein [Thermoanaerobaculia bacterium]